MTQFLRDMGKIYGDGITVTRGKIHTYLGMDFDYSTPHTVKVSMIKYAKEVLDDFPEVITSTSTSPAADHLFTVRDEGEAKLLPEEQAQQFHHSVAQLLFLCMRAPPIYKLRYHS